MLKDFKEALKIQPTVGPTLHLQDQHYGCIGHQILETGRTYSKQPWKNLHKCDRK